MRRMPERVAYATFERIADQQWRAAAQRGPAARGNLAGRADRRSTTRCGRCPAPGMRSYMRYWCDAFRLPGWSRERI